MPAAPANAMPSRNAIQNGTPSLHDEQGRDIGADAVERRVAEIELAGIAENEIKPDGQHDVERADDQVRAPVGVLEDERQQRDGDDGDERTTSGGDATRPSSAGGIAAGWLPDG